MKHRSFILVAVAIIPSLAAAQTPPVPPVPPVAPVAPLPPLSPLPPLKPIDPIHSEDLRRLVDDAKWAAKIAVKDMDHVRIAEEAKWAAQDAMRGIDFKKIADDAKWAAQDAVRGLDLARISEDARWHAQEAIRSIPKFDFHFDFDNKRQFDQSFSLFESNPPMPKQQWIQGDPADSIYQKGRETMSRYDYSRAAALFAEVLAKYPNSRRATEAVYYEAFSRYRIGTLEQLRLALKVLESNQSRLQYNWSGNGNDGPNLQAKILRALIERNESGAEGKLRDLLAKYPAAACDDEQNRIRAQVLSSLYESEPEIAMEAIKKSLATRDACSAELRQSSLGILARRPTEEKALLVVNSAKTDTVRRVRLRAIDVLAGMPGDAAINALQELMKDPDEQIQRAAVRSLMRSNNPRAKNAMRTSVIDNRAAPESQRIEAIRSIDRNNMSPDDAAYLRSLFNRKDESDRIKDAVITALTNMPSEENIAFLLGVAKNENETNSLRAKALRAVNRTEIPLAELFKLYDASDSRSMRISIVDAIGNRREEAAVNKLFDIARFSTDVEVKSHTVRLLFDKKDPAIQKRLLDLIK
jgi:HEAT repeat protein